MTNPFVVGQVRTSGLITSQIVAIAAKWDIMDTLVILGKVLNSDNAHVVSEISRNVSFYDINVETHSNGEEATRDFLSRAFGM